MLAADDELGLREEQSAVEAGAVVAAGLANVLYPSFLFLSDSVKRTPQIFRSILLHRPADLSLLARGGRALGWRNSNSISSENFRKTAFDFLS